MQRILQNPEATGRIVEWALELSRFGLKFGSTSTIQSRAVVEFITEWTPTPDGEAIETVVPGKESPQEWIMYFDGVFSLQGAGADVLLVAPTGEHLKYVIQMHFPQEKATIKVHDPYLGRFLTKDNCLQLFFVRGRRPLRNELC